MTMLKELFNSKVDYEKEIKINMDEKRKSFKNEPRMIEGINEDERDMLSIVEDMRAGDFKMAESTYNILDTLVRDYVFLMLKRDSESAFVSWKIV